MFVWRDFSFDEIAEQLESSTEEHDKVVERDDPGNLSIFIGGWNSADICVHHHTIHIENTNSPSPL